MAYASLNESSFVDIRVALGELILYGLDPYFDVFHGRLSVSGETIPCFRDGTSWKVKSERIKELLGE